jgi:hypothetical protein
MHKNYAHSYLLITLTAMAIMSNNLCLGLDQAAKNLQEALSGTSNPMAIGLRGEGTGFYHSSVRQPQDPAQVG